MPVLKKFTFRRQIGSRLLFWFLTIAIVPSITLAWLTYRQSRDSLEESVRQKLVAIAADKANQVETFALKQIQGVNALSRIPSIADAAIAFAAALKAGGPDSAAYLAAEMQHRSYLSHIAESLGYDDFFLVSPSGRGVAAAEGPAGKLGLQPDGRPAESLTEARPRSLTARRPCSRRRSRTSRFIPE